MTLEVNFKYALNTEGAAKFLGVAESTLERWRWLGDRGPTYYKVGGKVFYLPEDLQQFARSGQRVPKTTDPAAEISA